MHITFKYHSDAVLADGTATGVACFSSWIYQNEIQIYLIDDNYKMNCKWRNTNVNTGIILPA